MRLRNMLKICLVFWKSEPQYAYKRYAYKKTCNLQLQHVTNAQGVSVVTRFCLLYDHMIICIH